MGLRGPRSGLFFEVMRIIRSLQPEWVVLENVAALLYSNDCQDIEVVVQSLADCGYVGCFRVLDAAHFGSPAHRRRIFLVGRLGGPAPVSILVDAAPVESLPASFGAGQVTCGTLERAGPPLLANSTPGRITLGAELLVAEKNGWDQMVDRQRMSQRDGVPSGMAPADQFAYHGAGNAVHVPTAKWIAEKILAEINA